LQVRLLGPVEVIDDQGAVVPLASSRQRLLLAALCLRAGEAASTDWLVELLWGDAVPQDPTAALQSQMTRLRRRLGPGIPIATVPGAYRMEAPDIVDAVRFRRLVARTTIGGGLDALAGLEEALAMWRGRPLADLDHPALDAHVASLVEAHAAAAERRIAALIEHGAHAEAATAARNLSTIEPFREAPVALLMEALVRAGRPGEALELYERFRRTLADQLGLDPSAELRAKQRRVLEASIDPTRRALPREPNSSLVGRDDTLRRLVELLGGPGLVTLTGPGGSVRPGWQCAPPTPSRADTATARGSATSAPCLMGDPCR
jgi:pentatricopeptide repeat protein